MTMQNARPEAPKQSAIDWIRRHRGSLLVVALPTLLAAIYYFVIASDLYCSEAQFIVRSPSRMQIGGLAGLLQSSGVTGGQEDVYAVQAFMSSRDGLAAVGRQVDLRAVFSRPESDLLARYPNPLEWDNTEDFYRYFLRRVEVIYDTTTGITTLTVKAFRADDAQHIADILLSEGEALVNRLNQRAHDNAVRDAEADTKRAEDDIADAQKSLLDYRKRESLLDPGKSSGAIFEAQAKTDAELAAARTRLAELQRNSPNSPLIADLQTHVAALQQQVAREQSRLTGGDTAMAPKLSEYGKLSLREEFTAKELASALASLEAARAEARRQQIYLERVAEPSLPDRALYPKRLISVLIVFISFFLVYTIGRLLVSGVREHAQQ